MSYLDFSGKLTLHLTSPCITSGLTHASLRGSFESHVAPSRRSAAPLGSPLPVGARQRTAGPAGPRSSSVGPRAGPPMSSTSPVRGASAPRPAAAATSDGRPFSLPPHTRVLWVSPPQDASESSTTVRSPQAAAAAAAAAAGSGAEQSHEVRRLGASHPGRRGPFDATIACPISSHPELQPS